MGIALLTFSTLFQGLAALQQRLAPAPVTPRLPARQPRVWRMARPQHPRPTVSARPVTAFAAATRPTPLRVVRVCDLQSGSGDTGRLVISGRMADVCAELDRLAEREAAYEANRLRH